MERLRDGRLPLELWQAAMRDEVKVLHREALLISRRGDRAAITFVDWGRLGGHLRGQYGYLQRFAHDIRRNATDGLCAGKSFYGEKYVAFRSSLYGKAATASFWQGYVGDCVDQVPRGGQTQCGMNCRCTLRAEYDGERGVLMVWWVLHPAEHCSDCLDLAARWSPLEIGIGPAQVDAARAFVASLRRTA